MIVSHINSRIRITGVARLSFKQFPTSEYIEACWKYLNQNQPSISQVFTKEDMLPLITPLVKDEAKIFYLLYHPVNGTSPLYFTDRSIHFRTKSNTVLIAVRNQNRKNRINKRYRNSLTRPLTTRLY